MKLFRNTLMIFTLLLALTLIFTPAPALADAQADFARGVAAHEVGDYEKAVKWFQKAEEHGYDEIILYVKRGNAYYALRKYGAALADYHHAVENVPDDVAAREMATLYNLRGLALSARGSARRALHDFKRAIELAPDEPVFWYNRHSAYSVLGQSRKARLDYEHYLELRQQKRLEGRE